MKNLKDSENYRSADGTQYKSGNINGFQTTVIDYPSRKLIFSFFFKFEILLKLFYYYR